MWRDIIGGLFGALFLTGGAIYIAAWISRVPCARCGGTWASRFMRFQAQHGLTCEGLVCRRCFDELTSDGFREGMVRKGGVGDRPTTPRPPAPAPSQGSPRKG